MINKFKDLLQKKYQETTSPRAKKRFIHSINVMNSALELAKKYDYLDLNKVVIAALLHDYAKFETMENYQKIVNKYKLDPNILKSNSNVLHALLGGYVVHDELSIDDEEILSAIKYHSTGRANMTLLEKIIFISDYIEVSREGEKFTEVRKVAFENLDKAVAMELKNSLEHLHEINDYVEPYTYEAYNYYKKYLEEEQ